MYTLLLNQTINAGYLAHARLWEAPKTNNECWLLNSKWNMKKRIEIGNSRSLYQTDSRESAFFTGKISVIAETSYSLNKCFCNTLFKGFFLCRLKQEIQVKNLTDVCF